MNYRSEIRLLSRPLQSVNCEEIHSGRLQTTATYKASAEQLITERMIENSTTFMTGNVRHNCYPHIHLLPTHPHFASANFIHLLPVATSAHPLITHSRDAANSETFWVDNEWSADDGKMRGARRKVGIVRGECARIRVRNGVICEVACEAACTA